MPLVFKLRLLPLLYYSAFAWPFLSSSNVERVSNDSVCGGCFKLTWHRGLRAGIKGVSSAVGSEGWDLGSQSRDQGSQAMAMGSASAFFPQGSGIPGSGCIILVGSRSKTCYALGIKDQKYGYKNGISGEKKIPRYDPVRENARIFARDFRHQVISVCILLTIYQIGDCFPLESNARA